MQQCAILRNMASASDTSSTRATDRALALLSVVVDHVPGVSLADAARAVDLSPSTALRQLRALERAGFTCRGADGRWTAGTELLRLARRLTTSLSLSQQASDVLAGLAAATGESCYLSEPVDQHFAVYTAMAPGSHAIRHVSWLGREVPRASTAVGKALALQLEPSGAASARDAVEPGVTAIAAPVVGAQHQILGAISVVGPSYRLDVDHIDEVTELVVQAASTLSAAMGGEVRDREPQRVEHLR